jgi:hypothetical protein
MIIIEIGTAVVGAIIHPFMMMFYWSYFAYLSLTLGWKLKHWKIALPGAGSLPFVVFYAFMYIETFSQQCEAICYNRLASFSICIALIIAFLDMRKSKL